MAIELPNQWTARHYQADLMQHMFGVDDPLTGKRAVAVWHRRAGKDSMCLNLAAVASQMRVGTIWHMLPTLNQGKRVVWKGIDREGRRMIDQAFPPAMVKKRNNTEMSLELENGSFYQVVGSDNYDSLVGTNPVGVIFSEYSVADPSAWDYLRPILAENGGWAIFIYTFRGKNHGYTLSEMARENPGWYHSIKTVEDTYRAAVLPDDPVKLAGIPHVITPEAVQAEREAGMAEEKIQQEFYCSPDTGLEGSFYTNELDYAEKEGRIGDFPFNPMLPCQTHWDIGFRDATAVIVTQRHPSGVPILIDYFEERNWGLPEWVRFMHSLPYDYDEHIGPHDLGQTEWGTGKTKKEIAAELNFDFEALPKTNKMDGIEVTRGFIRRAFFNRDKVQRLLDCLYFYHREFDKKLQVFKDKDVEDWSCHAADAMRTMAMGWDDTRTPMGHSQQQFRVIRALR